MYGLHFRLIGQGDSGLGRVFVQTVASSQYMRRENGLSSRLSDCVSVCVIKQQADKFASSTMALQRYCVKLFVLMRKSGE